jgi:molecular chaperone DnaK
VTIQGASNLNEREVEDMLAEAEKYASADKEKRENIDLKNQAEALCFEAEKELSLLKDSISEEKQENIKKLIENIRQEIQNDNIDGLKSQVEDLKTAMKDMIQAKPMENDPNSDPMSNLNDL